MSSRNGYLSAAERTEAPHLVRALERIRDAVRAGGADVPALCAAAGRSLDARGWTAEYFEVRRQSDLAAAQPGDRDLVVLGAARLGRARLIDNLEWVQPAA